VQSFARVRGVVSIVVSYLFVCAFHLEAATRTAHANVDACERAGVGAFANCSCKVAS
jgi:hypothetical protein